MKRDLMLPADQSLSLVNMPVKQNGFAGMFTKLRDWSFVSIKSLLTTLKRKSLKKNCGKRTICW